jgi:tripeptide aminopeptidase
MHPCLNSKKRTFPLTEKLLPAISPKKSKKGSMKSSIIEYFIELISIDSESKHEKAVAMQLKQDLLELGAEVTFDAANAKTGGEVGNLHAFIPGTLDVEPILFCAHMDTVTPGNGVQPHFDGEQIITDGTTVLGGDDKSGIAQIIWAVKELQDAGEAHGPVEILFTISEEIGLLGAKHLDYSLIQSKIGYALDGHTVGSLVVGAPSQNSMKFTIKGKEAHAGVEPEKGVSAIQIAARAIDNMQLGRIDEETTCSVGIITGGAATNIIPNEVVLKCEARSHDFEKLTAATTAMKAALEQAVKDFTTADFTPLLICEIATEYKNFRFDETADVVQLGKMASEAIQLPFHAVVGGGGSDANIFNQNGLQMVIAGTGMDKVHTVHETINTNDLINGARWVKEVIRAQARK